ncbi:integrase family protein [Shewanella avicenniae]|uniref:Integrase family protein n=1 Tax=Shewanella avicenniae TaxID=2814294 RepID=A0ABX7QM26_9GAMM|nr:integrase arm-type DNA-binding domain-containing protein [Shewanella avicenniae]QSX32502.1 integrase family protein [Shewanella avicenniae]
MLNNMWLEKNNGKIYEKEISKADRDGLSARLRNGKISFIYRPRLKDGRQIRITLGTFPRMSLKEARERVLELAQYVADGYDPRVKVKAQQIQNLTAPTFDNLFKIWFERQCKVVGREKHWRTYELHVQKEFGAIPYQELKRATMAQFLISKAAEVPDIAKRILGDLRMCFDYHLIAGTIEGDNILTGINARSLGIVKNQRTRVLNDADIRTLYRTMRFMDMNQKNAAILELLLFYGCRGGELRHTKRDWLDFEAMTWTVPPEFHKTGKKTKKPIIRPILPEMRHLWDALLEYSDCDWLCIAMDSKTAKSQRQMSGASLQDISRQVLIAASSKKFNDANGENPDWEPWSIHDLRRTARSYWSDLGEWAVCEKMLGHKLHGEADVYDRATYTDKMAVIYRQWWGIMKALEHGDENIVPLSRKRVV